MSDPVPQVGGVVGIIGAVAAAFVTVWGALRERRPRHGCTPEELAEAALVLEQRRAAARRRRTGSSRARARRASGKEKPQ